jgi:hypothetical protein
MRTISFSLLVLSFPAAASGGEPARPDRKPKPNFTVARQTTYIPGPRDQDGYIDYVTALNKRLSKGVTSGTNANVLLFQTFGPHPQGANLSPEFFRWLGVNAPPDRGDYYIELDPFIKDHLKIDQPDKAEEIYAQRQRAGQRPWTAKQYPAIAAWLKANDKALAVAIKASRRPHYYLPMLPNKPKNRVSGLIDCMIHSVQNCRDLASALVARAMLQVGQGNPDAAWQDLLACHRLARLVGRGATLIEGIVGIAMDAVASNADLAFLETAKLDRQHIYACLRDLQKLPPLPDIAAKVTLTERFVFLDIIMMVNRGGIQTFEILAQRQGSKQPDPAANRFLDTNWDPALREINQWFDRLVAAMRIKYFSERNKKLALMEAELRERQKTLRGSEGLARIVQEKKRARGIAIILLGIPTPAVRKTVEAAERAEQRQANLHVAFALGAYHREHGRYPKKLDALAPRYLASIPPDFFNGKALIYRRSDNGYLLYSVGVNGKDDQGRGDDEPGCDDLSVRMPLPPLTRE